MDKHSELSEAATDLILEVFRFNGALLNSGDNLVRDLGLTSARWQVLGAIVLEERDLTVAQIARRMGLARQSVQRVVNDLVDSDLLMYSENPDHKRAKLVGLTHKGAETYRLADQRQIRWAKALTDGITIKDLKTSLSIIRCLEERCAEEVGQNDQEWKL
jgi:DNA-binding MarR family transcriptional regulator|tara:strand:- start:1715 stop:2194 length:480 start_codon:yes stop_codon:yes gene_type:complete